MTLVVEDGSGLANAESYISVGDADTYHTAFGNTGWSGDTATKEVALRNATQYIDSTYLKRWKGTKNKSTQALMWPRYGVVTIDGWPITGTEIPLALKRATAEAAMRALTEELVPDITDPGTITFYAVEVGPISEKTAYASRSQIKVYRVIDELLKDLILPSSSVLTIGEL